MPGSLPMDRESGIPAKFDCPVCKTSHVPLEGDLKDGIYACTCQNCGFFFKFKAVNLTIDNVNFTVNGKECHVGYEWSISTTLNTYLRKTRISSGTKYCCKEGGCGTCLVVVTLYDPFLKRNNEFAVNSCLMELYSCDGMDITTIEGLGNPRTGLHPIQSRLAKHDGAQCGFCTPGQVMNMYGLLKGNPTLTVQQIEDKFDATICRCTGYRSILDAMKTFAVDAAPEVREIVDIEELDAKMCKKTGKACSGHCHPGATSGQGCSNQIIPRSVQIVNAQKRWLQAYSWKGLLNLLEFKRDDNYRLVQGNTAFAVYKDFMTDRFDELIDIRKVTELYNIDIGSTVVIGANVSINQLQKLFERTIQDENMPYSAAFSEHLKYIATDSVRNLAGWAGNLVMKKHHPEFYSDIYLCLETVGAQLLIYDATDGSSMHYTLDYFFRRVDMQCKVIASVVLPTYSSGDVVVRTYKRSLRLQACVCDVNAGFRFRMDSSTNYLVKEKPSIVMGGISAKFTHAFKTESYLNRKQLGDPAVLKNALAILETEVIPSPELGASPEYRKSLALSLFYKFVLDVCKTKVNPRYVSGGTPLTREPIVGTQDYGINKTLWPVNEPMPKTTEEYLTAGALEYLDDAFETPDELFAAVVISTIALGTVDTIDANEALAIPGVVAFLTAKDIPVGGVNNWRPLGIYGASMAEELLTTGAVNYAGQPIGIIVANNETLAIRAANEVKVTYKNVQTPIVDINDGIAKKSFFPNPPPPIVVGDAKSAIANAPHKISGNVACGDQYHFHLETQTSVCKPTNVGGMFCNATTQWQDGVVETIAQILGIQQSKVTVETQSLGGAFGGKITQNFLISGLSALAAYVMNKPVKLHLDLQANMKMCGKRTAYYVNYQVGASNSGELLGVQLDMYTDAGWHLMKGESECYKTIYYDNAYYCQNWLVNRFPVKTNKTVSTPCRSPGSTPAMFIIESVMDHLARSLNMDPLDLRKTNLYVKGQKTPSGHELQYCNIGQVVFQLETDIDLDQRKKDVAAFNQSNRWKKRGLAVMPNRFAMHWPGGNYNTHVMIYHGDGSVAIAHGGIDMGQGINTKVMQVCAYELGIPVSKISCKKSSSTINANSAHTGGSVTTELCAAAVIEACNTLKARMAPVKAKMDKPTWEELVAQCYADQVDLTASYMSRSFDKMPDHYSCYSAACVEAEIDVLTGQYQLRQMDMLYDCGDSLNPELDIGQCEGGFMMGAGYFLTEQMTFDSKTGEVTNPGTWGYKVPMPKDLPMKFNFKFLRNAPNPKGVLGSKAVAEPPVTMAASCVLAIKHAVEAAREEIGNTGFFPMNAPATPERVQTMCLNTTDNFTFGK